MDECCDGGSGHASLLIECCEETDFIDTYSIVLFEIYKLVK